MASLVSFVGSLRRAPSKRSVGSDGGSDGALGAGSSQCARRRLGGSACASCPASLSRPSSLARSCAPSPCRRLCSLA